MMVESTRSDIMGLLLFDTTPIMPQTGPKPCRTTQVPRSSLPISRYPGKSRAGESGRPCAPALSLPRPSREDAAPIPRPAVRLTSNGRAAPGGGTRGAPHRAHRVVPAGFSNPHERHVPNGLAPFSSPLQRPHPVQRYPHMPPPSPGSLCQMPPAAFESSHRPRPEAPDALGPTARVQRTRPTPTPSRWHGRSGRCGRFPPDRTARPAAFARS